MLESICLGGEEECVSGRVRTYGLQYRAAPCRSPSLRKAPHTRADRIPEE